MEAPLAILKLLPNSWIKTEEFVIKEMRELDSGNISEDEFQSLINRAFLILNMLDTRWRIDKNRNITTENSHYAYRYKRKVSQSE